MHLLLTVRLHGEIRYHGMTSGAPEWPPSPARLFQALVAGSARGNALPDEIATGLEWLERLPPPLIAAPRAKLGEQVTLFVPNNDADALEDPRNTSNIRTKKTVHPSLFEQMPFIYAWALPDDASSASIIVSAADEIYQFGRGVDMAWATGEIVESVDERLREYRGKIFRPRLHTAGERALACPAPGSLASLVARHRVAKLSRAGKNLVFTNAPKPRFVNIVYEAARQQVVFELRNRSNEAKSFPLPLTRTVQLTEVIRNGAAARLRNALPNHHEAIERALIGRKADGRDDGPAELRVRIIPLPSIGHEHADRAIRRVLVEIPSGSELSNTDVEWAFSGLEITEPFEPGFVLTRDDTDSMLRHYAKPSRRWRSVTPVALAERRRRIEPARQRENAKPASERMFEETRAVGAVQTALRHANARAIAIDAHVQREPFESKGSRVEPFATARFAKERLWHVELELDEAIDGPLVIGDGRFLGLGVMAPMAPRMEGLFALAVDEDAQDDALALTRALRRAVMSRVQTILGNDSLGAFFSGHDADGRKDGRAAHLAYQWDAPRRRLLVIAPHWLEGRAFFRDERDAIGILQRALEGMVELRAGTAGRFELKLTTVHEDDRLLMISRRWKSIQPYAVTRHASASAHDVIKQDVLRECHRRKLPQPTVTVLSARGLPGQGLEGQLQLEFSVAVAGPIILGRTRFLGGGLFAPAPER